MKSLRHDLLPFHCEIKNGIVDEQNPPLLISSLKKKLSYQLVLLRHALSVSFVTLLWKGFDQNFYTYSWSADKTPLPGPFDPGEGILGIFKERNEIALHDYRQSSPKIPYLKRNDHVGRTLFKALTDDEGRAFGLLSLVSECSEPWDETAKVLVKQCAALICSEFEQSRDQIYSDFERQTMQQVFNGLRTLNSTLGLESVYNAADKALRNVVDADLVVFSSVDADEHQFEYLSREELTTLKGTRYPLFGSITGQVVKYRCTLPEYSMTNGAAPVVATLTCFDEYPSVLVVPLSHDDGPVTAVLIVASRRKNQFSRHCREMIEMIAAQLAVKLDLARAHEQINAMTLNDSLTGIANRRAFDRAIVAMSERATRRNSHYSLVLCDIDFFKKINDSYGHPFGDQVIQQVARQLSAVVRTGDLAARVGGEEFALLLEGASGKAAYKIAERVRRNIEHLTLFCGGESVSVTISLGIAVYPDHQTSRDKLFETADDALYQAKQQGRNRTICH